MRPEPATDDVVVVAEGARDIAPRRLRDRVVGTAGAGTRDVLAHVTPTTRTLTFAGRWEDLSADICRVLAEWAAEDPRCGCGVLALPQRAPAAPTPELTAGVAIVVHGDRPIRAAWTSAAGHRALGEQAVLDAVTGSAPPVAVAIGGHGSEHCLRFGTRWLTVDPRVAPPGTTLHPDRIRCAAVMLSSCGALRLADSPVPMAMSVAAALHAGGAAVVGPFRNSYAMRDAERLFAAGVAAAMPMGQVVNALNRERRERDGAPPGLQLLGDAARVVWTTKPVYDCLPSARPAPDLEGLIARSDRLERLVLTITRWAEPSAALVAAHVAHRAAARMLFVTDRVSALTPFTDAELDALATAAHAAGRRLRLALLEQVAHWIADRWIDEVYAPCYRRPIVREGRCPRCDGFALGYVHVPYAAHLLVVERVDCDRCGAFGDRVGEPPERDGRLAVAVSEDVVAIRHCGHPNAEAARLVIRDAGVSREWPPSAGRIDLPLRALTKRGRLVLAGVRVADGWIAIEYHALFVAP